MAKIGKTNRLQVVKLEDFGAYLDAQEFATIFLPKRHLPNDCAVGDWLDVFIYRDSEDELVATTVKPKAQLGECAYLKVTDVSNAGAFLDWGLPKDLLVPYNEQHKPMEVGKSYVVTVLRDAHSDRLIGSSKLSKHLSETSNRFKPHQQVDLLICGRSDMGSKAVINNTHLGLIFRDDAFKPLKYGQRVPGYIKNIRSDGKIDLSLQLPAGMARQDLAEQIVAHLQANGGMSGLTDKAAPDDIYHHFNVSKKTYKKALGTLYKQKRISISDDRITLL
jgi:predicted RNA-binding protein (virulence factor B family)